MLQRWEPGDPIVVEHSGRKAIGRVVGFQGPAFAMSTGPIRPILLVSTPRGDIARAGRLHVRRPAEDEYADLWRNEQEAVKLGLGYDGWGPAERLAWAEECR